MPRFYETESFSYVVSSDSDSDVPPESKLVVAPVRRPVRRVRVSPFTVEKDLIDYRFPDRIKEKAVQMAVRLSLPPRKSRPKLQQIFFCVLCAYAELGQICDPQRVAAELELSQKDVNSAYSAHNQAFINYSMPKVPSKAENYVTYYLEDLGIDASESEFICGKMDILLEKDPSLREKYPQDFAIASILYHLQTNGFEFKQRDAIRNLGRSPTLISNLIKYLELLDNA